MSAGAATLVALAQALVAQGAEPPAPPAPPALTKAPKLLELVRAPYPEAERAAGREGTVGMWIDVDAAGQVQRVEVVESAGLDFDRAAMSAAAQFVFEPAEAEGLGPVPVRIRYRYRFTLEEVRVTKTGSAAEAARTEGAAIAREEEVPLREGPINLHGRILEAGTRAPVAFASVQVFLATSSTLAADLAGAATATDADARGAFALRGLPPGKHQVRITAPYFQDNQLVETIRAGESLEVAYFLERAERNPFEVVVRAKIPRKEISRRTLVLEEIQRVPGAQGDAIRVIQNMPGVARTPFGIGLLVVRGAPPQSTGVFLDGHRIPLLFHFGGVGGLTSVVNSRALDSIQFMPGGFGPEYGRLGGGVVELTTKDPKTDRIHGEANLEMLALVPYSVGVFLEGPLTSDPDDGAFVFSLRRSSIDGVISLATEITDASVALAPRYYDYQARYVKDLGSKRHQLSLFAYGSDDEIVVVGAQADANAGGPTGTQSRTYFHRVNPRYTFKGDDGTKWVVSPILGVDFTDVRTSGSGANANFAVNAAILHAGGRTDATIPLAPRLTLQLGGDLIFQYYTADTELPAFGVVRDFPSPVATDLPTQRTKASAPAVFGGVYAELELKVTDQLTIWPGVRGDFYSFAANDQPLLDPRLIEGRQVLGLDPRITARFALRGDLALKAQAGIFREPPLPTQVFLNAELPLIRTQQYAGGFEYQLIDDLLLDVTGFFRFADDVPRGANDVVVINGTLRPVGFLPDGLQRSYGLELLLKLDKRWGLYGWIAYTLSRSEIRRDDPDDDWDASSVFDQTHNLNVVAVYELGLNWNLGARFRLVSGSGTPSTETRWYDADRDGYSRQFGEIVRTPVFNQLDIYVEKRFVFESWYLEVYLDVQNVYLAQNTEFFVQPFDLKSDLPVLGLPIFPSVGIRGVF